MGGRSSHHLLSYEDASKRLTAEELERINSWYKRAGGSTNTNDGISVKAFTHEILCDDAPDEFSSALFEAFGGSSANNRGLPYKDLICGLAVVAKGSKEERVRFLFNYFSSDGEYIHAHEFFKQIKAFEQNCVPNLAYDLFRQDAERANLEQFLKWVCTHRHSLAITDWLLAEPPKLNLSISKNSSRIPTFFSTLAGVTHLQEKHIEDLEKQYKLLVDPRVGKLTVDRFRACVQPPLPESVVEAVFGAFDENNDSQVDFKELVCAVSECCRAPPPSRLLFCLKAFDTDRDGYLSKKELRFMFEQLLRVRYENSSALLLSHDEQHADADGLLSQILPACDSAEKVPLKEVANWLVSRRLADDLLTLLFQICHVVFGLLPASKKDEAAIVNNWRARERLRGYAEGQNWYLISRAWWNKWEHWIEAPEEDSRSVTSLNRLSSSSTPVPIKKTDSETSVSCLANGHLRSDSENGDRTVLLSASALLVQKQQSVGSDTSQSVSPKPGYASRNGAKPGKGVRSWSPCPRVQSSTPSSSFYLDAVDAICEPPGPIDNSSLIASPLEKPPTTTTTNKMISLTNEGGILKPKDLSQGDSGDFQLVPEPLWFALTRWYKGGGPVLCRKVIRCPQSGRLELELYPIQTVFLRHQQTTASSTTGGHSANLNPSFSGVPGSFVSGISAYTMNAANTAMSVFTYWSHTPRRVPMYSATFSKLATVKDIFSFLCRQLRLNPETARLWLLAPDENNMYMLEDEDMRFGEISEQVRKAQAMTNNTEKKIPTAMNPVVQVQILVEIRNSDLTWPEEMSGLVKNRQTDGKAPASTSVGWLFNRSGVAGEAPERGLTGLTNLGNTCFMNAALQCVSNTKPLTQYFIKNMHLYELNKTNTLGRKGQMALQYANLIHELWSGKCRVVAPLKLRCTVCKYASQFNDFQQHDSQELLSFLIDGLHEDLNRVHQKPYAELKDSDGRLDEIVAAEAWDNHSKRNQSVIVDLFHGLLRSEVTCRQCCATSVRFDPFTFLSLPLPLENFVFLQVVVVRLDGSTPVKYGLRLMADDRFESVVEQLIDFTGVPKERLLLVQLAGNNLIQTFINGKAKVKPYSNWTLYAYETPPPFANTSNETKLNGISSDDVAMQKLDANGTLPKDDCPVQIHAPFNRFLNNNGGDRVIHTHSRSSSNVSATSSIGINPDYGAADAGGNFIGYTFAIQRRVEQRDVYIAAHNRYLWRLFGLPIILPADIDDKTWSGRCAYETVMRQLARFLSNTSTTKSSLGNHAVNGDHRPGEYPFVLRVVQRPGAQRCARCPWYECCSGCTINSGSEDRYLLSDCFVAIDWDPTELHLRYQPSAEMAFHEHSSVKESLAAQMEPVSLDSCLRAFTTQEELKDNDTYYCGKCKARCPASKKLDIWKLPPVLIFHFKRFQCINENRWVKSCKTVTFPINDFDPSSYLADCKDRASNDNLNSDDRLSGTELVKEHGLPNTSDSSSANANHKDDSINDSLPSGATNENRLVPLKCGQHDHRLLPNSSEESLHYNLYAIVCHTGMLGAGHYVTYTRHSNGKWYLYNDSSCKEVSEKDIDYSLAYILFYERQGLDYNQYMPDVTGLQAQDVDRVDEECEAEVKRLCSVQ